MWIAPFFHREASLFNQPVHCLNACFLKGSSTKVKEERKKGGQAFLIAEKTFTAERFILKQRATTKKACTAEDAEGFLLKQKATTKDFHR